MGTPTHAIVYRRPTLYPKQAAAIFTPARTAVIEATPKSGKTAGCMAWLLERALAGPPGQHYWWIAPVFTQAEMVFTRFMRGLPRGVVLARRRTRTLRLPNHAVLWFKSGDHPDALYGEDVHAAVIDEATRCKEAVWHAVRTTLTATRGPVRVIGNVKGRRNWAYRLARQAEAGEIDMHYARLTALDAIAAGLFDAQELRDAETLLPPAVFRELYYAEPSDDEGNPFGLEAIRAAAGPLSSADPYVWGWDLAKRRDWTVGIALDQAGTVCRVERFQDSWERIIQRIRAATGDTPALVDSTGVGDPVVERLRHVVGPQVRGFRFAAATKQQVMEGLAMALQEGRVRIPKEGPLVPELEAFEYRYTRTGVQYTAPEGLHDDCVVALALAVQDHAERSRRGPLELLFCGGEEDEMAALEAEVADLKAQLRGDQPDK